MSFGLLTVWKNIIPESLVNQHGGFYGIAKHVPLENHIFNSFDKYYTWGNEKGSKIVKKMPSFRLYSTKKN